MVRSVFMMTALIAMGNLPVRAQTVSFVPLDGLAQSLKIEIPRTAQAEKKGEIAALLTEHVQDFALYARGPAVYASLVEEARLDKQVGASAATAGSTTLVSRGSVPSLIGLAVESGALYQSVNKNVVTFRLNPAGLARALAKTSYLTSGPAIDAATLERGLNRISASASLDLSTGTLPGTFTGERSQLREAAVRFDVVNRRDPRHPSHAGDIQRIRGSMAPLVDTITEYHGALINMPGYEAWRLAAAEKLVNVSLQDDAALKAALFEIAAEFAQMFGSAPQLDKAGRTLVDAIKSSREVRNEVFRSIARSSVFTVEYAFNRLTVPADALALLPAGTVVSDVSTARLIFSSPVGSAGEAVLNGSASFFNSTLSQMHGNLRDIQIAGSLEYRLPTIQGVGSPVLTLAGLGAFLHQQPFGVKVKLRDVETADGAIGVFQTKLTLPAGTSGVQLPVSFTVANRSEFNTEKEVRASFGMTFDLDRLFSR